MTTTVAIVGCTHAGTFVAQSLLAAHPSWTVHVFERNSSLSFLSCGIALWVGGHVSDPARMFYSSPEALAELGAQMHMRTDVTSVNVATKQLCAHDMESGAESTYAFDKLYVTTGSKPVVPPIEGLGAALGAGQVLLAKNWDHGRVIKERAQTAGHVAVIGAGYIGAELAEQLSVNGVRATLIDMTEHVLAKNFDAEISARVEDAYREHGVELALGQKVVAFEGAQSGQGVCVVTDKGRYDADFAILGAGFLPRTELFAGQLEMLPNGAIKTDEHMRAYLAGSSVPSQDVFAAGDAACIRFNPTGGFDYIPLATNAVRQALVAAANVERPVAATMGTQATSAVQLYDLSLAQTGLTLAGAAARGLTLQSVTITEDYRPDFMLSTAPVTATLVWDPETRKIKGAQFMSTQPDVAQAANAISIAIQAGFTIDELAGVDLLFQPNFSQPVNYIASVALKAVAQ